MGHLKSFVLYHKNGVITEERFQKMSSHQWLFHFFEILKYKKDKTDMDGKILELVLDRIDLTIAAINPSVGKKLFESKEGSKKGQQPAEEMDDMEFLSTLSEMPALTATWEEPKEKLLPKYNRKLGIIVEE